MIQLVNVTKKYGNKIILENFNYQFENSGLYFLIGQSGTGKTTLLNLISGLISPSDGKINYENIDSIYQDCYYSFQDFNLFTNLTLIDNIKVVLKIKNKKYDENKAFDVLTKVGLIEIKDKKPAEISGGERQRLSIAIALILESKVLILDEPTSSLDEINSKIIIKLVREIKNNILVIVSTHDKNIIEKDDIVIDLENFKVESINNIKVMDNKKQKNISLNKNIFFIKSKIMNKQVIRMMFEILILILLITFSTFIVPLSNLTRNKVTASYISNQSHIVCGTYSDRYNLDKYYCVYPTSENIHINKVNDVKKYITTVDDKKIEIRSDCFANFNENLKEDEIILTKPIIDDLYDKGFINGKDIKGQKIKLNDTIFTVLDVIQYEKDFYQYNYGIEVNSYTYIKAFKLYYDKIEEYISHNDGGFDLIYYDINNSLQDNECTLTYNVLKSMNLENVKVGDKIRFERINNDIEFKIKEIKDDDSYIVELSKNNIMKIAMESFRITKESVLIKNIYNFNDAFYLIETLDSFSIDDINSTDALFAYYDSTANIIKVILPILLLTSVIIILYISYYSIKDNQRNFDTLRLLGVSKKSMLFMSIFNQLECIIISILLSIIPCILLNHRLINASRQYSPKIQFSYNVLEFKYFFLSSLIMFVIICFASLFMILIKKKKYTYIN